MDFGIDISRWQKGLNLTQAIAEGVTFAIIKAGGADAGKYKDSQFDYFYADALENHLPVGAYYFGCSKTVEQAREEAHHFLSIIDGKSFPLKVWYDIEGSMSSLPTATLNAIAKEFCATMAANGFDCGVYASLSLFNQIDFDKSFSAKYRKWVAYWGRSKPLCITDRDMWQYGGETNFLRDKQIANCKTVDQNYCFFSFDNTAPKLTKPVIANYPVYPGNIGPNVATLQRDLNYLFNMGLSVDGVYGPLTRQAVKDAQIIFFKDDPSEWDGIYGPKTYKKLKEALDNAD